MHPRWLIYLRYLAYTVNVAAIYLSAKGLFEGKYFGALLLPLNLAMIVMLRRGDLQLRALEEQGKRLQQSITALELVPLSAEELAAIQLRLQQVASITLRAYTRTGDKTLSIILKATKQDSSSPGEGEWDYLYSHPYEWDVEEPSQQSFQDYQLAVRTADFLAHSKDDISLLLQEVIRLKALLN